MQHRVKAILESESIWSLNRLKCQLQPRHSEGTRTNKYTKQAVIQTLAKISVKIGGINRTSRTSVRVEDAEFRFEPEGSFGDFYARAEERIVSALSAFDIRTLRPDTNLYAKPSQGATQQGWVALTE
ncbi:unnamed protein product [Phytophthora fragariaefolia]|uniref:Unnamed protein product n=1 Tax=Phytophthora fragariaefolia TaxID=1490495 RepID=A0A9W7CXV1_9STRA|nr:unnamed protein product [Phytophthora fragariaefolia]